jgi:hypothetical protein
MGIYTWTLQLYRKMKQFFLKKIAKSTINTHVGHASEEDMNLVSELLKLRFTDTHCVFLQVKICILMLKSRDKLKKPYLYNKIHIKLLLI